MKPSKKSLTNKLDKLCSNIIRKNPCAKCGDTNSQCAHIFSRTYRSVRWDLLNMIPLCASCHFWGHKNPILFSEFVRHYLGEDNYILLKRRAIPICRWTIPEMIELKNDLERRLSND